MKAFLVAIVVAWVSGNIIAYSVTDEKDADNDLEQLDANSDEDMDPEDRQENDSENIEGTSQYAWNHRSKLSPVCIIAAGVRTLRGLEVVLENFQLKGLNGGANRPKVNVHNLFSKWMYTILKNLLSGFQQCL